MKLLSSPRLALPLLLSLSTPLIALQPPEEGEWEQLLDSGHFERRLDSAYKFGNHQPGPALARRAGRLRQEAMAARAGWSLMEPSNSLPDEWWGVPSSGEVQVLVFLIDFADQRADEKFPGLTPERIDSNLFGPGTAEAQAYAPRESMRNFYERASNGKLLVNGETHGWYHFEGTQFSYKPLDADDDIEMNWQIAREVLEAYDADIDYSRFDNDGDGYVDALNIIWSGEKGEWSSFWWGYRWSFWNDAAQSFTLDGVRFRDFSWQWVETREEDPTDYEPRVIIHEFGHLLGFPDLYDYEPEIGPEGGVGGADVMDSSRSGNFNAYFRWLLGWIEPAVHVVGDDALIRLTPAAAPGSPNPAAVVYFETPQGGTSAADAPFSEMLVLENRQPVGNDGGIAEMPTGGLAIWHVHGALNEQRSGFLHDNSRTEHKLMRLVQRDGNEDIEQLLADAEAGDLFLPGDALSPWTRPAPSTYAYTPSRLQLDPITGGTDDTINVRLSTYTGPLVRVRPSHLQLRTAPGMDHPPTAFTFTAEGESGTVVLSSADLLETGQHGRAISFDPAATASAHLFWNTADKPLHVTRERIRFEPDTAAIPPVSVPVQVRVRIPLEDALSYPDGFWDTGRHRPWFGQDAVVKSPPFAVASGQTDHDRQSYLSGWVWGPGWVSFSIKVSTEAEKDIVRFQLDGTTELELSGEQDWLSYIFYTDSSGWVQVRFVYARDEENSAGADRVWVDDFQFNPDYQTRFEYAASLLGLAPDPASLPFTDGRPFLEHFAFAPDYNVTSRMPDDVAWPQLEFLPESPTPILRVRYPQPHYGVRYVPQGSPDGLLWYTLTPGQEGVTASGLDWGSSTPGTLDLPLHGYRFFRLNYVER